jgi:quercetin dioxygenase-like cupin family protein
MKSHLSALCLAGMACLMTAASAALPYPTNVNTLIARTDTTIISQKIVVPKNPTVIFSTSTFAPGARTPVHKHPYPHYVCIEAGTLTVVRPETGTEFLVKSGSCFVEMIDKFHYGINKGAVPVRTLVVDQVPAGVQANSMLKDPTEAEWQAH